MATITSMSLNEKDVEELLCIIADRIETLQERDEDSYFQDAAEYCEREGEKLTAEEWRKMDQDELAHLEDLQLRFQHEERRFDKDLMKEGE